MKSNLVLIICLTLVLCAVPAIADYLKISVATGFFGDNGDKIMSDVIFMDNHLVDSAWSAPTNYQDMTLAAAYEGNDWFSVIGPATNGCYLCYIFSGIHVEADIFVPIIFSSVGKTSWNISIAKYDGAPVWQTLLTANNRTGTDIISISAGLNQKRTRGYKLTASAIPQLVPKPASILILSTGLICLVIRRRRR